MCGEWGWGGQGGVRRIGEPLLWPPSHSPIVAHSPTPRHGGERLSTALAPAAPSTSHPHFPPASCRRCWRKTCVATECWPRSRPAAPRRSPAPVQEWVGGWWAEGRRAGVWTGGQVSGWCVNQQGRALGPLVLPCGHAQWPSAWLPCGAASGGCPPLPQGRAARGCLPSPAAPRKLWNPHVPSPLLPAQPDLPPHKICHPPCP